jgi:outer membrane protein assembly factor BamB
MLGAICALVPLGACDVPTGPAELPRRAGLIAEGVFGRESLRWFIPDSAGAGTMDPLLDGPRVYFGREAWSSPSGARLGPPGLRALDRSSGAPLWKRTVISAINAALAGDRVGAVWGSLATAGRASGAHPRDYSYGPTSLSGNVVSDGTRFYLGTHDGHVLAVDPTGATAWDRGLAGGPSTPVFGLALSGDALAVTLKHFRRSAAEGDSAVVALLDRATGAPRWRVVLAGDAGAVQRPVITSGVVIAVTEKHEVFALDQESGAVRWQKSVHYSSSLDRSDGLSACDGMVVVATGDMGATALDASTGTERWRVRDLGAGPLRHLECSHGTVLALGSGPAMHVLDARTGTVRARYPRRIPDAARGFFFASATRDETSLYVGTSYGFAKVAAP